MRTVEDIVERVRAEFLEMPGLRLSAEQIRRLCGLDGTVCQIVLDQLLDTNFLRRTSDGQYIRTADGRPSRANTSKPSFRSDAQAA